MKLQATLIKGILISILLFGVFWCGFAWAAETVKSSQVAHSSLWSRATWDEIMRWLNFIILATLIVKYGRTPMVDFLTGKRAETAHLLKSLEEKKSEAEKKIQEGQILLQDSKIQLENIVERIVSEGRKRKEQIIESAQHESRILMEAARTRIDHQIQGAYRLIRSELIEAAVEKAMVKLPKMITDEDHERMIGLWMEEAQS